MVMGPQQRFWRRGPRTKNRALRDRYNVSYLLRAGRLRASDILSRNRVPVQRIRGKNFLGPNGTLRDRYSVWDRSRPRRLRESATFLRNRVPVQRNFTTTRYYAAPVA